MSPPFLPSPEQQAVIDAPLTSLRVSAGAGTGKTTTLAHRVVALVDRQGVEPEQILGITFTNKAAEELTERIGATLGDRVEPARGVEVHTYHGFAASLLREFGPLVGVERDSPVVTPAFSRQMLADVVRGVRCRVFDPTIWSAIERLRRLEAGMADNLLMPETVIDAADPDDQVWAERLEMLDILGRYHEEKRRLGVCDYGDLIRIAHELVVSRPEVAEMVAERYRAVLLDEYQDTNPAQRELLRELFAGRVPVTAVGDEDQTIYEWRGASLANFRAFPEHFPLSDGAVAPTLPLTRNRRSGPLILEVANTVRARVDSSPRNALQALEDAPAGSTCTGWFETAVHEADWIAGEAVRLHDEGRAWRDIAILFRKNRDMLAVHDALARHGIPFEVANLGGLLTVPEVAELHAWLRLLGRPEDGPALARLLMGTRHRLGLGDLAHLARWTKAHRRGAGRGDNEDALPDYTLLEAVDHLDDIEGLRPEAAESLQDFRSDYRRLLSLAQGLSLVELCRSVLDITDAWADIEAMDPAASLSARLNVYRFLDLAENWSPLEGHTSLEAFLVHLDLLAEEDSEELDTARVSDSDAVTLITVHRAKGLEWPVVMLPAVYRRNFPNTFGAFDDPFRAAELLPYRLRIDAAELPALTAAMTPDERKELLRPRRDGQEWRIAYVAVTRAKEALYVTGAHWYGHPQPTKKPQEPSELWHLVDAHDATDRVGPIPEVPPRPDSLGFRSEAGPAPDPLFPGSWPSALRAAMADPAWSETTARAMGIGQAYDLAMADLQQMLFDLPEPRRDAETTSPSVETSVTGLVTYASCPRRYFWSEVDRLPRRAGTAARRGVDVHRRIELHHRGAVPLEELSVDLYDTVWGHDETPTGDVGDPFEVFAGSRFAGDTPVLVESPFEVSLDAGIRIRGRIDAVYDHGDRWEVVDFKSGRPRNDAARLVQLQAYAVAVEEVPFGLERPEGLEVTFAYLGAGQLVEEVHEVDAGWMESARRRLRELGTGIAEETWDPIPSEACGRCDFLRFCPAGRAFLGKH